MDFPALASDPSRQSTLHYRSLVSPWLTLQTRTGILVRRRSGRRQGQIPKHRVQVDRGRGDARGRRPSCGRAKEAETGDGRRGEKRLKVQAVTESIPIEPL
jgi:hypothetical protein